MSLSQEDVVDVDAPSDIQQVNPRFARWLYENFLRLRNLLTVGVGVDGTFTTADSKTVTVKNGIITSIT
jgi:hypothetical protein